MTRAAAGARAAGIAAALALFGAPWAARGQEEQAAGTYKGSPQQVAVDIQSWGDDCGPKPKSYTSKGGDIVTVTLQGDNLFLSNGTSTKKCWSENRSIKRLSASKKGMSWVVVCETPENESRFEHGEYSLSVAGGAIKMSSVTTYNWQLKESICKASITITKSYEKTGAAGVPEKKEPPPKPEEIKTPAPYVEPEQPPPPPEKCVAVGPVKRIVLSPSSARLGAGQKVCFGAAGLDEKGCRVPVVASFSLSSFLAKTDSRLDGACFTAGTDAALSEGTYRVTAWTEGGLAGSAKVEVRFNSIEDLIAVNLTPSGAGKGEAGQGKGAIQSPTPPAGFIDVPGPTGGREIGPWAYVIAGLVLLLGCGVVAILIGLLRVGAARRNLRRGAAPERDEVEPARAPPRPAPLAATAATAPVAPPRQPAPPPPGRSPASLPPVEVRFDPPGEPPAATEKTEAAAAAVPERGWMRCPVCKKEQPPGSTFCPQDGSRLVPFKDLDYQSTKSGMICPQCRRGYAPSVTRCPADKTFLVPYPVFVARKESEQRASKDPGKKKICPVCRASYGSDTTFCASDGTKLEPIQ